MCVSEDELRVNVLGVNEWGYCFITEIQRFLSVIFFLFTPSPPTPSIFLLLKGPSLSPRSFPSNYLKFPKFIFLLASLYSLLITITNNSLGFLTKKLAAHVPPLLDFEFGTQNPLKLTKWP